MLVISRFRGDAADLSLGPQLEEALEVLSQQRGYVRGAVGRNVDDPGLWVLCTRWENVGSYRRALSSYEAKLLVQPLLFNAVDEPSAYEIDVPGTDLNVADPRSLG